MSEDVSELADMIADRLGKDDSGYVNEDNFIKFIDHLIEAYKNS